MRKKSIRLKKIKIGGTKNVLKKILKIPKIKTSTLKFKKIKIPQPLRMPKLKNTKKTSVF